MDYGFEPAERNGEGREDSAACLLEEEVRSLRHELAWWQQRNQVLKGHLRQANQTLLGVLPTARLQVPVEVRALDEVGEFADGIVGHVENCRLYRDDEGALRLFLNGWTWSFKSRIAAIDLFVESRRVGGFAHGGPRDGVRKHFEGPPEMAWSGFGKSVALPSDFSLDAELFLQVCDEGGRCLRFGLHPAVQEGAGIGFPRQSWVAAGIARAAAALHSFHANWRHGRLNRVVRRMAKARFAGNPTSLSFVLLVDEQPYSSLSRCVESVTRQFCACWELLVLARDASGHAVAERLAGEKAHDARIRVLTGSGFSRAESWNEGLERASGDCVCFLSGGELLADDALAWALLTMERDPEAGWCYSDRTFVDANGRFARSDYKPDFSDVHLWSTFFTSGFSVYRKSEVLRAGGFGKTVAGAEEYDLALRLASRLSANAIVHIPHSLSLTLEAEPGVSPEMLERRIAAETVAVRRAVQEAGTCATVRGHESVPTVRRIEFAPRSTPEVIIVIPTRDKADLLRRCLASLRRATSYSNYRVLIVNNQSTEPALQDLLDENVGRADFEVVDFDEPFNHSLMHNQVLGRADAEFVVLLNNDVVHFSEGWLEHLVATAQIDPQISAVGTLLLYPDGRVQHGGVILDPEEVAKHAHVDVRGDAAGYANRLQCLQDLSACTAACLLIRLSAFHHVGGFDALRFPNSFNDVDLCLRLRDAGYRCLYQPAVRATHYESASRGVKPEDIPGLERLRQRLWSRRYCDPFHNPNLSGALGPFRDRFSPEEAERWKLECLFARLGAPSETGQIDSSDKDDPSSAENWTGSNRAA